MSHTTDSVRLHPDGTAVVILDQTQLPNRTKFLELRTAKEFYDAIASLAVRGAPAIGICAGYAMAVLAHSHAQQSRAAFLRCLEQDGAYLISSRPTAVNLSWAVQRMLNHARTCAGDVPTIVSELREESIRIHKEDIRMCRAISEHGVSLLHDGDGVLTHCNAGPLATSRYGTALGPLFLAQERGINLRVFADETRPLLQGARLTSYELAQAQMDVTLICDNMASLVMKNGWVQACFVGCDRVAANGDTANKIGTSGVAILAKHYGIPFYVLGPSSSIDRTCATGADIVIEQRPPDEVKTKWYREPMAPENVTCYNPAFDVTDHALIAGIVTEYGICRAPFAQSLAQVFAKKHAGIPFDGAEREVVL